jgi:hypothetical protein
MILRSVIAVTAASAALVATLVACSSSSSTPIDLSNEDSGAAPDASPVICNMLANTAPVAQVTTSTDAPPTPTGGTIVPGTYYGTSFVVYVGDAGLPPDSLGTESVTYQFASNGDVQVSENDARGDTTATATFATSGTSLTITDTCPDDSSDEGTYSVTTGSGSTPSTVTFYLIENGLTVGETLTLQSQ